MKLSSTQSAIPKQDITHRLSSRGIMLTRQRRVIADVLFARNQHITADQLFEAVNLAGGRVSKATVYNTLGLFVRKGLVRAIYIDASRTFYDSNTSHHHHFYNVDTGELTDMHEAVATHLVDQDLPQGTVLELMDLVIRVKNKPN
ncbi:MAG: transcriptional repressor [Candidatus Thiodiazotropha sp.]|jgi:Fur family transcriptional regulator, iron response regulator